MKHIKPLPPEYSQYNWIAEMLSNIDGVEDIMLTEINDHLIMRLWNGKEGAKRKHYDFPLKEFFIVDYTLAENCDHYYDINKLNDPMAMAKVVEAKATMFFNNITLQ